MAQFSVREAAAELGVHPARITHWIASGKIRAEWVDGPHGRMRCIDEDALTSFRRAMAGGDDEKPSGQPQSAPIDESESLARARAIESYTAGLAATAIAPAVARLVETIEQLTRENGDLREQIGSLRSRLELRSDAPLDPETPPLADHLGKEPSGLADEQWEALRGRLERLSEPAPDSPPAPPIPNAGPRRRELEPSPYLRRRRRESPWTRFRNWIQEVRA